MKFETPKMNISIFAAENVVTDPSGLVNSDTVNAAKDTLLAGSVADEANIVTFVF